MLNFEKQMNMRKCILISAIFMFIPVFIPNTGAQLGFIIDEAAKLTGTKQPDPVYDKANEKLNQSIEQLLKEMRIIQDKELSTPIELLKQAGDIMKLIEDLVCLQQDFGFYLSLTSSSCINQLNRNFTINKVISANLMLTKLIYDIFNTTMTSGNRLALIEQLRKTVEEASREMQKMNLVIRAEVNNQIFKKTIKRDYYTPVAGRGFTFLRYKNK